MTNSILTLEKERMAQILSLKLIRDGANEEIAHRLNSIHERTDRLELKKDFLENFKRQLGSMVGINEEEVPGFVSGLDATTMECFEKRVTSRCRILAWFEKTIWSILLLLIFGSLFKFFGETASVVSFAVCCVGVGIPIIGPLFCLMGHADRDFFLTGSIGYMKDRKQLIRIYGREYFSCLK